MSNDDRPPEGLSWQKAVRQFADPDLLAEFDEAIRAAPKRFVVLGGATPEQQARGRHNQALRNAHERAEWAVLANFRSKIDSGDPVAIGHPRPVDAPAQEIQVSEWGWLPDRPNKDGTTFEGNGRTWCRVLFYSKAEVEAWRERQRCRREGMTLLEAVLECTDPKSREEIEDLRAQGYGKRIGITIIGGRPDPPGRIRCSELLGKAESDLREKIVRGECVMIYWRDAHSKPTLLEPHQASLWRFDVENPFQGSGVFADKEQMAKVRFFPADAVPSYVSKPEPVKGQPELQGDGQRPKNRAGRPPKYDWDGFWTEVVTIANTPDGLLSYTQAALEKKMLQWCENNWDQQPGLSTIRQKLSRYYRTRP